jgi:peptidoglycan-associated lipoprotein
MSIALLAVAFLMAGCAKKNVKDNAGAGTQVPADSASTNGGANGAQTDAATAYGADANGANGAGANAGQIIYFDFDKTEIKSEYAGLIATQAHAMAAHPGQKLRLEGSTDERGTREYNIGLGERRAQAVRRALMLQGVPELQLTTVSFGEERPAVEGDDESAWAKNRRVEMVLVP